MRCLRLVPIALAELAELAQKGISIVMRLGDLLLTHYYSSHKHIITTFIYFCFFHAIAASLHSWLCAFLTFNTYLLLIYVLYDYINDLILLIRSY